MRHKVAPIYRLPKQVKAVGRLLRAGSTDEQIAERLGTNFVTVKRQMQVLFRAYGCVNRIELAILMVAPLDSPVRAAIESRSDLNLHRLSV